jgi:hypothetical protein
MGNGKAESEIRLAGEMACSQCQSHRRVTVRGLRIEMMPYVVIYMA